MIYMNNAMEGIEIDYTYIEKNNKTMHDMQYQKLKNKNFIFLYYKYIPAKKNNYNIITYSIQIYQVVKENVRVVFYM